MSRLFFRLLRLPFVILVTYMAQQAARARRPSLGGSRVAHRHPSGR